MTSPSSRSASSTSTDHRDAVAQGRALLGIELGSTRVKAVLTDPDGTPLASGGHNWENQLVDGVWTYSMSAVEDGLQGCYAALVEDVESRFDVRPTSFGALGVSAMMHGYLALDAQDELLVPFRTWRNTSTERAATELSEVFERNVPLRWSVAHLYQAVLDEEPHLAEVAHLTTLAGYVHWRLSGQRVLGVGDASGMFPLDQEAPGYDADLLERFDRLLSDRGVDLQLAQLLPEVLVAGQEAGSLTAAGAALLDPTGRLEAGLVLCPPEGDAGTGMVATNAVAPRSGNVSVGTSIFAMAVLEHPLSQAHPEIDLVATPAGAPVAMVHCNNGASELSAWADLFGQFAQAIGADTSADEVFAALLEAATSGEADGGGLMAFNHLSGEPIVGLAEGRPMVLRTPGSQLTLANFMRTQLYSVFATLSLGMRVLREEGVELDTLVAHGGLLRTPGVAQRLLASALEVPVAVGVSAEEGGAWGMAVLAGYLSAAGSTDLVSYLEDHVFASASADVVQPEVEDVRGFATFLDAYVRCLDVERAAVDM